MIRYKKLNRKHVKNILKVSFIIGIISAVINSVMEIANTGEVSYLDIMFSTMISFTLGFLNPLLIMSVEIFIFSSKKMRSMPALLFLIITIISYFIIGTAIYFVVGLIIFPDVLFDKTIMLTALISLVAFSAVINIALFFLSFLGTDFLKSYLLSRYHQAHIRETVFMFIDMADSTKLGEKTEPDKFFHCLNDFLFICEEVIKYYEGIIYKYVGDCIIVVWEQNENNIIRAYKCVKDIRLHIKENKHYFSSKYDYDIKYTIGVHTGAAAVGEIGYDRKEIGYLSDTVNTAQRIQSINKDMQTDCLFSHDFMQKLQEWHPDYFAAENLKQFRDVPLKGKMKGLDLYTLDGKQEEG